MSRDSAIISVKKVEITRSDSDGSSSGRKQLATSLSDPISILEKPLVGNKKNSSKSKGTVQYLLFSVNIVQKMCYICFYI